MIEENESNLVNHLKGVLENLHKEMSNNITGRRFSEIRDEIIQIERMIKEERKLE